MEAEIRNTIKSDGWNQLYTDIRIHSMVPKWTSVEASRPENRLLNRYGDVSPYDHSRVVLQGAQQTDYINASLVKAPKADRQYILAQGPLASTVSHFWLMVWEQRSKAVLMLNRIFEKGVEKCHQYWPRDTGGEFIFADVGLKVANVSSEPGEHYTVRRLRLSKISRASASDDDEEDDEAAEQTEEEEEEREILHFHYTTWPDFGTPACPDTFLEFLRAVRDSGSLEESVGPAVVHCSAGIGRSGTFVLVDTCLVQVAKEGSSTVCIRDTLLDMRNYRMGLVQTAEQLKFSYLAIAEGAREWNLISQNILADLREELASSNDDDGPPPPLPPPGTESLMKSATNHASPSSSSSSSSTSSSNNADNLIAENGVHDSGAERLCPSVPNGDHHPQLQQSSSNHSNSSTGGSSSCSNGSSCSAEPSPGVDGGTSSGQASGADAKTDTPTYLLSNHKLEERKREMEVRRRKKEEQNAALESKIEAIKRKTKEAEEWKEKKQRVKDSIMPIALGFVVVAIGSCAYYFRGG